MCKNKLENEHKGRVATKNCAHIQKQAKKCPTVRVWQGQSD
ncbi:hypothetical protein AAZX31_18G006500 [Glycine max]